MDNLVKFIRWYVAPLQVLRLLPHGDGAFVALSIGCFLCERYYRAETGTNGPDDWNDNCTFKKRAAEDFNVSNSAFHKFWNLYRNGQQHQASPKIVDSATKKTLGWSISGDFDEFPTKYETDTHIIICTDPWKFADSMISKFLNNREILDKECDHSWGEIFAPNTTWTRQLMPRPSSDCSDTVENPTV